MLFNTANPRFSGFKCLRASISQLPVISVHAWYLLVGSKYLHRKHPRDTATTLQMPESKAPMFVHVKTGDRKGAGTDANIRIRLVDNNGVATNFIKLTRFCHGYHERGMLETFPLTVEDIPKTFGEIDKVELSRDSFGLFRQWFLDIITIEQRVPKKKYYFPVQRWIEPNRHYSLRIFDTCLPQYEDQLYERLLDLSTKKKQYEYRYSVATPGLPTQVKTLPEDERFSGSYRWDIVSSKLQYDVDTKVIQLTSNKGRRWESWEDLKQVYHYSHSLDLPTAAVHWHGDNDFWFGIQRVQGCNPVLITLCKEIPTNFPVDTKRVAEITGGLSLEEMLASNRLFIINLKLLEGLPCRNDRIVGSPIALFYLSKEQTLLPMAIQLFQKPSKNNPIFYATDNQSTWLLAKMWYNNADASYHQSCTHLGFTHFMMEGVVCCTHRNLAPSHPIFRLLAPHFLFLMAINTRGLQKLINPGGWVDKTMTLGCRGLFELMSRGCAEWRMHTTAIPPKSCAVRGVDDPKILPWYPYRDDATAIYNAINEYVTTIINHFYDTTDKVHQDSELQSWAYELTLSKSRCGVGINGVPGGGKFTNAADLITTISAIICTCSVGHAAANFMQYDEYGFPPSYPAYLFGKIPTRNHGHTEKDILNTLPPKRTTLDTMVITRLLSDRGTKSLGQFEMQYLYDPVSVAAADKFRATLNVISENIQARNKLPSTRIPYKWLDPAIIPNAISI